MFLFHIPTRRLFANLIIVILLLTSINSGCVLLPPATAGTMTTLPDNTATSGTSFESTRETAEAALMQTQLALFETVTPNPPPTGIPPTSTLETFIPGITGMSYAPYVNPQSAVITSQWREIVNGQRCYVYAGAHRDTSGATPDTSQGLIIVDEYSEDLSNHLTTLYDAPGTTGVLQITRANGYRLTIVGLSGEILYFDVLTRQFVDGMTVTSTAPTITPLPSITPTAIPSTPYPLPEGYTPPPGQYPPPLTSTPLP